MILNGKRVELTQLRIEGIVAGVSLPQPLGIAGDQLVTYDDGNIVDVPAGMAPVLAAHIPPPAIIGVLATLQVAARVRTTDATPTEIFRRTLAQVTEYEAEFKLRGIDAGNGVVRRIRADVVAERLMGGAVLIGTVVVSNIQTPSGAAATTSNVTNWAITAAVSGNDFVITVTGSAGRTIDWLLSGAVDRFSPSGLTD